jgi:hypothetical protein
MKIRTGTFRNSPKAAKGKNKGQPKNAGRYTKGKNRSAARPNYHRTGSTDVILSLTREMENDLGAFPVTGGWAVGFIRNPVRNDDGMKHSDLAEHFERMYGKRIYTLSPDERKTCAAITDRYVQNALNNG